MMGATIPFRQPALLVWLVLSDSTTVALKVTGAAQVAACYAYSCPGFLKATSDSCRPRGVLCVCRHIDEEEGPDRLCNS